MKAGTIMSLLDTDHVSIVQREQGDPFDRLMDRLRTIRKANVYVSVISFHEQMLGIHDLVNRAKTGAELERGYVLFVSLLKGYCVSNVAVLDGNAIAKFEELKKQKVRIGTMDLRIAAIAVSKGWTLLTRNTRNFEKVPELKFEDWTA